MPTIFFLSSYLAVTSPTLSATPSQRGQYPMLSLILSYLRVGDKCKMGVEQNKTTEKSVGLYEIFPVRCEFPIRVLRAQKKPSYSVTHTQLLSYP